jgi:cytochrome c oxidase subunit 2
MKGLIIVETQEEYDKWLAGQKPQYAKVMEERQKAAPSAPAPADSTKTAAAGTAAKIIAQQLTK